MAKQTIDWEKLKQEFLASKFDNVATFLKEDKKWSEQKAGSGNVRRKVTGWGTEKAQMKHKITEEKKKEIEKKELERTPYVMASEIQILDRIIEQSKPYYITKIYYETVKVKDNKKGTETTKKTPIKVKIEVKPEMKGLKDAWEVVRTTLGKTTRVVKNQNIEEVDEEIKDYMANLTKLLDNNVNTKSNITNAKTKRSSTSSS